MQSRSEIEVSQRHALTPGWLAVSGSTREVVSILRRLSGDANTCERVVTLLPASACRMHLKATSFAPPRRHHWWRPCGFSGIRCEPVRAKLSQHCTMR